MAAAHVRSDSAVGAGFDTPGARAGDVIDLSTIDVIDGVAGSAFTSLGEILIATL